MDITQLVTAVYTETNRPDLVDETLQAVLESILTIHSSDDYVKDIVEAQVVFDYSAYIQTLDTTALPNYRSMKYFRKNDPSAAYYQQNPSLILPSDLGMPPGKFNFLERVDPDDILDNFDSEKTDIWYMAGNQINIKSSTSFKYALAGWYAYPDISNGGVNLSSWIAREFPYVIVYRAAGTVFAKIGEDKSYAMYMAPADPRSGSGGGLYRQLKRNLDQNNILA